MRVRFGTSETAPLAGATLVMFDSFIAFNGVPGDLHKLVRHTILLDNDQVGTLRLLSSIDGATWRVVDSVAVAIPIAPLENTGPVDFAIDGHKFYQITFINGATNQASGTWKVQQEITEEQRAAQT